MTKTKSTKRALLMSGLALLMCVSMFIGSTFAWFTDSVTSAGNIIKSGTLDVTMEWADGKTDPANTTWTDASTGAIFNYELWEPGYTEVRHIRINNVGTLAFKYFVNIKANGEVSKLADVIDVYFVDPATQVSDRSALLDTYKVGTLTEVLAGTAGTTHGDLLAGTSDSITIALKMQESAGNEYQNMSIGTDFSVQIMATQLTYEKDSFDDQYDKDAVNYVTYDPAKTVAENAAALQAAIDSAAEGDIILVGAGNWFATKYKQFTIKTDNVTLVGENGAVLGFGEANANSVLDVYGDNVTIRNIEFNKNYNETNQLILAYGAENLTVDNCAFYGKNTGNTPTMGIYMIEQLDNADDEKNDAVTKYTITNNSFNGAAVGSYKGGSNFVTTDPGVITATVSKDMVIENNTFIGSSILIEGWRSWRKENTRDHEFVPTIKNNNFVSPNLCFDNTPHSIYLRCYRQGNPDKILPAGYIDAFVANNNIATPTNDTVKNYNGTDYVLSDEYGCFYRDNATYGIIAYCYGQSFATLVDSADELGNALANGDNVVYTGADLDIDESLTVKGNLTINNATIDADAAGEIVVDGGTLTLGKGAVLSVEGEMPTAGVIRVIDDSEIVLDGAEIKDCDNKGTGVLINVAAGAKMTIEDGTVISGNIVAGSGNTPYALIKVCGELVMNGGKIVNNEFAHKALISIEGGKFVMNGGTIANNTFTGTGSTSVFYFFTSTAKFEMNGGTISGNNLGSDSYSAVFNTSSVNADDVLVVNGGTISAAKFAYARGFNSLNIASDADVSGSVYAFWDGLTKDVNDIKE